MAEDGHFIDWLHKRISINEATENGGKMVKRVELMPSRRTGLKGRNIARTQSWYSTLSLINNLFD